MYVNNSNNQYETKRIVEIVFDLQDVPLACDDGKKIRAHLLILAPVGCELIHATPQCARATAPL